jgi:hypothetical protein
VNGRRAPGVPHIRVVIYPLGQTSKAARSIAQLTAINDRHAARNSLEA